MTLQLEFKQECQQQLSLNRKDVNTNEFSRPIHYPGNPIVAMNVANTEELIHRITDK
jgi:hypothetical protein